MISLDTKDRYKRIVPSGVFSEDWSFNTWSKGERNFYSKKWLVSILEVFYLDLYIPSLIFKHNQVHICKDVEKSSNDKKCQSNKTVPLLNES